MGKVAASTLGVTKEVSSLQLKDGNGVATAPVSEPLDASVGGGITAEKVLDQKLGAVAVAAGMEGATTGSIGRAGRRSLSEFGELAQVGFCACLLVRYHTVNTTGGHSQQVQICHKSQPRKTK